MSVFGLNRAFQPKSLAVVGAGPDRGSLGGAVFANLRSAGFPGRIDPINPRHSEIAGQACFSSIEKLEAAPDLLVVATPAATLPEITRQAVRRGVGAAIVLTAGLGHGEGSLADEMHSIARAGSLRIIGPNCLGVLAPHANLNASFAAVMPRAGQIAVISQSGAIAAAMAEWGHLRGIGFSAIVSLGDQVDVDLGDLLDYFALDRATQAILLYVESIKDARKFMSAARAASRAKPVVVIKSGRHAQGAKAAATHTGALAGSDAVYDAAFRRAGLLRVYDMAELFAPQLQDGFLRSQEQRIARAAPRSEGRNRDQCDEGPREHHDARWRVDEDDGQRGPGMVGNRAGKAQRVLGAYVICNRCQPPQHDERGDGCDRDARPCGR